jgi:signal transduction histidine kinase
VNDLLSLSRNNRVNDNLAPMNLMVEVNNTVSQFYHTTDTSNLEIIPIVYQPVPFVADLTRVRIVLNNLISNAFKYRSYKKSRSFVRIEIRVDAEKTVVVVADNGTGIQKSRLPRIFDMFYRASENSEGSGLGLYIVKNVLDKIQGSISVESEEGIGSVFTVEFPNHWNGKW